MSEEVKGLLTTDIDGKVTLPDGWFAVGDTIKVKRLIHTEPEVKHDDLMLNMYYVTIDNAQFFHCHPQRGVSSQTDSERYLFLLNEEADGYCH